MKKTILASVAATALIVGLGAAKAAEPGEEQYFHERGNIDVSAQRGWSPGPYGWGDAQRYGSGYGYSSAPLGFAPIFGPGQGDFDD